MTISAKDQRVVRNLAQKVAEIAGDPINRRKHEMWTRLNRLERVRPLIHVQATAWNIWEELIPAGRLETTDAFERTRDNVLEVNLQDLHTVQNEPRRLTEWTEIALQLAEECA